MRLRSGAAYAAGAAPAPPTAAALPHEVLVRIFSLLPRGALAVTPGRVSHAWAAAKAEAWAAALQTPYNKRRTPVLPGWYLVERYGAEMRRMRGLAPNDYGAEYTASHVARHTMRFAAALYGAADVVRALCAMDAKSFDSYTCSLAAKAGRFSIVKLFHELGCEWDERTCTRAAANGDFRMLRWCVAQGCEVNENTCDAAAEAGHLEMLKWLREEQECPWYDHIFNAAALGGDLPTLEYLYEHGRAAYWSAHTCACAATGGSLEAVAWLRARGCPWNYTTIIRAAEGGSVPIIAWCRENGLPWDKAACRLAAYSGQLAALKYCVEHGCPIDVYDCISVAKDEETCEWLRTLLRARAAHQ
jgi:hypothetical protein